MLLKCIQHLLPQLNTRILTQNKVAAIRTCTIIDAVGERRIIEAACMKDSAMPSKSIGEKGVLAAWT